ncbi:MAG TPA: hypothetical protein VGB92_07960 [Longimicrobium sp.]
MRAIIAGCRAGRIAAALVLALLGSADRAAAQPQTVTTCVARPAGLSPFTMPVGDTAAFQDSIRRTEPLPHSDYAGEQPWFTVGWPIVFRGQQMAKWGWPLFLDANLLRRVSEYNGVGVYVSRDEWWMVGVIYLPVRAGCEFQTYQAPHWGIPCSSLGCPFARESAPAGAVCRLRGDELVWEDERRPEAPAQYAESRRWYAADRLITFQGHRFGKMGLPQALPPGSVRRIGELDGVGVYVGSAEIDRERTWGFYVPVRRGCLFQLYEDDTMYPAVRGE